MHHIYGLALSFAALWRSSATAFRVKKAAAVASSGATRASVIASSDVVVASSSSATCSEPCPYGQWDGQNCYMFDVPFKAEPFIYYNHFYYKGVAQAEPFDLPCPYYPSNWATGQLADVRFDGANCLVMLHPGTGQMPFIYDSKYYLAANCWGNKVVTLGDSYASGTGIHNKDSEYDEQYGGYASGLKLTPRSDNECWRELHTTPGPRYAAQTGQESVFLACKGAEAIHVENQMSYANLLHAREAFNMWDGSVLVVDGAGNDIRTRRGEDWPELLERCILELNPFVSCDERSENQVANWPTVKARAKSLYTKLAVDAARAKIRILGYPRVMQRDPNCGSVTGVGKNEADWMDDMVDVLNAQLLLALNEVRAVHVGVDIRFVSVLSYITKGACASKSIRQVNDRVLDGISTSDASFHPTQAGYDGYLQALAMSLV